MQRCLGNARSRLYFIQPYRRAARHDKSGRVGRAARHDRGGREEVALPSGRACHFERSREISRATFQIRYILIIASPSHGEVATRVSVWSERSIFNNLYHNGADKVRAISRNRKVAFHEKANAFSFNARASVHFTPRQRHIRDASTTRAHALIVTHLFGALLGMTRVGGPPLRMGRWPHA